MQTAEKQSEQVQNKPNTRQLRRGAVSSSQNDKIAQLEALAESSPQMERQGLLAAQMHASPAMTAQRKFGEGINNSPRMVAQRKKLQSLSGGAVQLKEAEAEPLQGKFAAESPAQLEQQPAAQPDASAQLSTNNTGLPDNLKSGVESLSGMSMDHVKVHYNSSQPAQLSAQAYAQGSDIHVAPGQEQHLPHEAWHVVQQAQGRVQPTRQMKGDVPVNDDRGLEHEADVMGAKAAQMKAATQLAPSAAAPERTGSDNKQLMQWKQIPAQLAAGNAGGTVQRWAEHEHKAFGDTSAKMAQAAIHHAKKNKDKKNILEDHAPNMKTIKSVLDTVSSDQHSAVKDDRVEGQEGHITSTMGVDALNKELKANVGDKEGMGEDKGNERSKEDQDKLAIADYAKLAKEGETMELGVEAGHVSKWEILKLSLLSLLPPIFGGFGSEASLVLGSKLDLLRAKAKAKQKQYLSFGDATMLGGDHVMTPDDLKNRQTAHPVSEWRVGLSLDTRIGLTNRNHFFPLAGLEYEKHHEDAINYAKHSYRLQLDSGKNPGSKAKAEEKKQQALRSEGVALHFFQDTFASGHMYPKALDSIAGGELMQGTKCNSYHDALCNLPNGLPMMYGGKSFHGDYKASGTDAAVANEGANSLAFVLAIANGVESPLPRPKYNEGPNRSKILMDKDAAPTWRAMEAHFDGKSNITKKAEKEALENPSKGEKSDGGTTVSNAKALDKIEKYLGTREEREDDRKKFEENPANAAEVLKVKILAACHDSRGFSRLASGRQNTTRIKDGKNSDVYAGTSVKEILGTVSGVPNMNFNVDEMLLVIRGLVTGEGKEKGMSTLHGIMKAEGNDKVLQTAVKEHTLAFMLPERSIDESYVMYLFAHGVEKDTFEKWYKSVVHDPKVWEYYKSILPEDVINKFDVTKLNEEYKLRMKMEGITKNVKMDERGRFWKSLNWVRNKFRR